MSVPINLDPGRWGEVARWLDRAADDLGIVDLVLTQSAPSVFGASLHCQQAAEKMAKAVLIAFGVRPPRVHDLNELADLIEEIHPDIGVEVRGLSQLTTWYSASRYPDIGIDALPSVEDIQSALTKVRALHLRVRSLAATSK